MRRGRFAYRGEGQVSSRRTAPFFFSGPYPERELRHKYRMGDNRRCGRIDADMLASDDGFNAWGPAFRPPSNSAFEGSLPVGRLWWFPRIDMVDLFL